MRNIFIDLFSFSNVVYEYEYIPTLPHLERKQNGTCLIKKTMTYGDYGRYVVKLTMDMNMPAEASKIAEDFMFK